MPPEGEKIYKSNNSEPTNPIKDLSNDLITRRNNRSIIIVGDMNARTGIIIIIIKRRSGINPIPPTVIDRD